MLVMDCPLRTLYSSIRWCISVPGTVVIVMERRVSGLGTSGFFAKNLVLLVSLSQDLQCTLEWFAAECEAAELGVSSPKSETIVLNWK